MDLETPIFGGKLGGQWFANMDLLLANLIVKKQVCMYLMHICLILYNCEIIYAHEC